MIGAPDKYPECCKTGNLFVCRRVEYILYSNTLPPMICRYYIIPARAPDQSGITYTSVGLIHMIPWRRRPVTCPCRVFPVLPDSFPAISTPGPPLPLLLFFSLSLQVYCGYQLFTNSPTPLQSSCQVCNCSRSFGQPWCPSVSPANSRLQPPHV